MRHGSTRVWHKGEAERQNGSSLWANEEVSSAAGTVVFIDDDNRYMYDVKHEIRFVNVKEYAIDNADKLYGFICGMCAQNFDITAIYFDAFLHMIKAKVEDLEGVHDKVGEAG